MARDADAEEGTDEEEIRVITDHPDIDGIDDLDGDVEQYDVGIDNLDDLSVGDVVRYTSHDDPAGWHVVTGRHDSTGGIDETDIIEMKALNDYGSSLLSRPASVASLHASGAFGELEVRTGWSALRTRLAGKVREKRDAIQFRRGGVDA